MAEPTFVCGPKVTVAKVNDHGLMQCVECDETFGPATEFASRFEEADRWMDADVNRRCREAGDHYLLAHGGHPEVTNA